MSDTKKTKEQLVDDVEYLARFPSENPHPVLRIGADGILKYANDGSARILEEWKTAVNRKVPREWRDYVAGALGNGAPAVREMRLGNDVYSFCIAPVPDAGYANLYGSDITEQRRAEAELKKHEEDLEKLVEKRTRALRKSEDELRKLSSQLSLAEEQERKRLATALHDSVGQTLALSKLRLGELGRLLSSSKAQTELTEIRSIFEKGIQQLRSLTFELSPPILYELGLAPALEWLGEQFEQRHAVRFHFEADGRSEDMDEVVSVLMFQSAREIIANIGKHAGACHVKASVSMRDGHVGLVVEDDGRGFDPGASRNHSYKQHSFGLFSIRERMRHIGGTMGIESKPGGGTTVTLSAPVKRKAEEE